MSGDRAMSGSGLDRVALDAYFTEAAAVIALARAVPLPRLWWEPFAGAGHIARVGRSLGFVVYTSDIHNYGFPLDEQFDFFARPGYEPPIGGNYAIVTNSPFKDQAERFLARALALRGCSVVWALLRNEFDCAGDGLIPEVERRALIGDHPKFFCKVVLRWRLTWETPEGAIVSERTGEPEGPRHNYAWYGWNLAAPARKRGPHGLEGARILYADRPRLPGDAPVRAPQIPKTTPRRHWQDRED